MYSVLTNYDQRFAVKTFEKSGFHEDKKAKQAFINEIEIVKQLDCRFIVPFDYLFETEKAYYMKMEFFKTTFKEKIKEKLSIKQQK